MPEYLDGLNEQVSLAYVFKDLYERADELVAGLDNSRRHIYGERTEKKDIPNTGLELAWPDMERGYCPITVFTSHETDQRTPLISRTEQRIPPQYGSRPESVSAFRSREAEPDYSVAQERPGGLITCRIGRLGIRGKAVDRRLVGTSDGEPADRLAHLNDTDRERLRIVSSRIARNLEVVELMSIGATEQEATEEADRALAA